MSIDRVEVNRALAKAIAFKACGQHRKASAWAGKLVKLLECADILDPDIIFADSSDEAMMGLARRDAQRDGGAS
jgi:hypothetical protein